MKSGISLRLSDEIVYFCHLYLDSMGLAKCLLDSIGNTLYINEREIKGNARIEPGSVSMFYSAITRLLLNLVEFGEHFYAGIYTSMGEFGMGLRDI